MSNNMKIVVLCLTAFFCLTIIFFTFFGERLYYSTKPEVELERMTMDFNGSMYLPESAVFEEADGAYVYTVDSENGFSTEILTVTRHKLIEYYPDETGYFDGYVAIVPEEDVRGVFVVSSTKPLHNGARVVDSE